MAITPQFIERPFSWITRIAAAGPSRSDSAPGGVLGTTALGTASSDGAMIDALWAIALGTNVATTLRLWIKAPYHPTPFFYREIDLPASNPSGTASSAIIALPLPAIITPVGGLGLRLGANVELHVSLGTGVAAGYHICAQGGHYGVGYGGTGGGTP